MARKIQSSLDSRWGFYVKRQKLVCSNASVRRSNIALLLRGAQNERLQLNSEREGRVRETAP